MPLNFKSMEDRKIVISTGSIFKILAIALALYFVYVMWDLILILFVALILAALIDPFANWFQKRRIPRALAVIVTYVLMFGLLGTAIALITPIITQDIPQLVDNVGDLWNDIQQNEKWQSIVGSLQQAQESIAQFTGSGAGEASVSGADVKDTISGVFSTITGFVVGVATIVLVLVITFYMVVQDDPVRKIVHSIVPAAYVPYTVNLLKRMRDKLALWVRGQFILSMIIGLLVFVGLTILGIEYAAVLALLAALFEFVPYVGPVMAAIPGIFLAFTQGGAIKMVMVLVMYIIIQQLENHVLVPKVMQKAVGLNPIVSIIAILTGAKIAGPLGALIAIPVATALSVFVKDIVSHKQQ